MVYGRPGVCWREWIRQRLRDPDGHIVSIIIGGLVPFGVDFAFIGAAAGAQASRYQHGRAVLAVIVVPFVFVICWQ